MPRVVSVDPLNPSADVVEDAARVLRSGGLVAFPTETVYGLGARALDPTAAARIFVAKGRPAGHPLIVHVLGVAEARALAGRWTEDAAALTAAFWPGGLTVVVDRGQQIPDEVTGGGDSVALRAPSHPLARALIAAAGPLAAPSANRYQSLSATTAAHVVKSLGDAVDLVLDGGPAWAGIESTVVDARTRPLRLLRPGAVSEEALAALGLPLAAVEHLVASAAGVHASPGQDAKHYAPRATLALAPDLATAEEEIAHAAANGVRLAVVVRAGTDAAVSWPASQVHVLPADAVAYARELFTTLHRLDDAGVDRIVVVDVPHTAAWSAVRDRLRRASSHG